MGERIRGEDYELFSFPGEAQIMTAFAGFGLGVIKSAFRVVELVDQCGSLPPDLKGLVIAAYLVESGVTISLATATGYWAAGTLEVLEDCEGRPE